MAREAVGEGERPGAGAKAQLGGGGLGDGDLDGPLRVARGGAARPTPLRQADSGPVEGGEPREVGRSPRAAAPGAARTSRSGPGSAAAPAARRRCAGPPRAPPAAPPPVHPPGLGCGRRAPPGPRTGCAGCAQRGVADRPGERGEGGEDRRGEQYGQEGRGEQQPMGAHAQQNEPRHPDVPPCSRALRSWARDQRKPAPVRRRPPAVCSNAFRRRAVGERGGAGRSARISERGRRSPHSRRRVPVPAGAVSPRSSPSTRPRTSGSSTASARAPRRGPARRRPRACASARRRAPPGPR